VSHEISQRRLTLARNEKFSIDVTTHLSMELPADLFSSIIISDDDQPTPDADENDDALPDTVCIKHMHR
jgi:hypothetical protein